VAAPAVATFPTRIDWSALPAPTGSLQAVIGLADDLAPVTVDLRDSHFVVIGPYRSGKSTALAAIAESLARGNGSASTAFHLLAPRRSSLVDLGLWASVARGPEECVAAAQALADAAAGETSETVVFVDDGEELAEGLASNALELLLRRGRDGGTKIVAACERQAFQRAFGGWLRDVRRDEHGLLLDPDIDIDGEALGARLPRRTNLVFPPGRGYVVRRGDVSLVQIAQRANADG
jgi:S-DNA-T family DNA segregation ATPase FtsK/SpoIIIE